MSTVMKNSTLITSSAKATKEIHINFLANPEPRTLGSRQNTDGAGTATLTPRSTTPRSGASSPQNTSRESPKVRFRDEADDSGEAAGRAAKARKAAAAAADFKDSVAPATILRRELAEEGSAASRTLDVTRGSAKHQFDRRRSRQGGPQALHKTVDATLWEAKVRNSNQIVNPMELFKPRTSAVA
jgi:hypothetical protein